jgi:hypothetical protein
VVTVAALIGCGSSSSGGGGGSFTTSVPAGTKLTALTPAQGTQLCTDFASYESKTLTTDVCKTIGLEVAELAVAEAAAAGSAAPSDAALQMACTQSYNGCLSGDGGVTTTSTCTSTTFSGEPSTCTATVGDLETCANDQTTAVNQLYGSLPSCASLTSASLASALATLSADGGSSSAEPASCTKFDSQCNGMSMLSGSTN